MNEQVEKEELSLLDLLKVLLSKIKLLILVLLCGGVLGGAIGFVTSYDVRYWGTNMEFYVNPVRPTKNEDTELGGGSTYGVYGAYGKNVMDNIVRLLNSESFAELMILNGELLPEKGVWADESNEAEAALKLDDAIDAAQAKIDASLKVQADYEAGEATKEDYELAVKEANEKINETLLLWRRTKKYRETLTLYMDSINFSYMQNEKDLDNAVDLARSFIYVEISVLGANEKEFKPIAEDLLIRVQQELPKYVREKMIIPDGYVSTSCTQITTITDIDLMNDGYILKESIKFALLLAAVAFVVACVIVIFLDRSDKRVRDYDVITRQLNVPLLGVIPSIDDDNIAIQKKEQREKKEA